MDTSPTSIQETTTQFSSSISIRDPGDTRGNSNSTFNNSNYNSYRTNKETHKIIKGADRDILMAILRLRAIRKVRRRRYRQ